MVTYSETRSRCVGFLGVCTSQNMVTYSIVAEQIHPPRGCMHITKYGDIQPMSPRKMTADGVYTQQNKATYS